MTANTLTANPNRHSTSPRIEITDQPVGRNLPQRIGRALWAPMLLMALMAWPIALVLGVLRSQAVTDGDLQTAAALGQFVPAAAFVGFAAVFSAIAFSIARILGEFRVGGGQVQLAVGAKVHTLAMPLIAKAFLATMAMAMMLLVGAVVAHVVVGIGIAGGDAQLLANAERWSVGLEAVRRFGSVLYLFSILLGLATITTVIRFQVDRLRAIASE